MSQVHLVANIGQWVVEALWFIAVAFSIVYGTTFSWWDSMTGIAAETLGLGVVFALLKGMLTYWGVPTVAFTPSKKQPVPGTLSLSLTWFALFGLFMVALAITCLTIEAVINIRSDPEPATWFARRVIRFGKHDTRR